MQASIRKVSAVVITQLCAIACGGNGAPADATETDAGHEAGSISGSGGMTSSGGQPASGAGGTTNSGGSQGTGASAGSGGLNTGGTMQTGSGGTVGIDGGADGSACEDICPMATGLTHGCEERFALGINYAWHQFAADFGGISAWGQNSVSQDPAPIDSDLAAMQAGGVSVVRWWVFPDFRSDGVLFDASGDPTGLSATAVADIDKALELAAKNNLYLALTIFSFDNFRPDQTNGGIFVRGLSPMVRDTTRRAKVTENIVRPLAHAVAQSANASRVLGWDIINEPEWAISATGTVSAGSDFSPNPELDAVSLDEMKALISESAAVLKQETPGSLTTAGWAAAKWSWAFQDVNLDFDEPHIYAWVDQYWPYTSTPSDLGYSRPVVMGEFFLQTMPFSDNGNMATYGEILDSWWSNGYSGAWGWQYIENAQYLSLIGDFKTSKGCPAGF